MQLESNNDTFSSTSMMNNVNASLPRAVFRELQFLHAVRENNMHMMTKMIHRYHLQKSSGFLAYGNNKKKRINLNYQDKNGMAAIHHAALAGNVTMLKMLLDNEVHVDLQDSKGLRPLHHAAWQGRNETAHLLLNWGSACNAPAYNGLTPLHLACQNGHYNMVKLLLCFHGDVNAMASDGRTPFDLACEFGRTPVVELLLNSGQVYRQLYDSLSLEETQCSVNEMSSTVSDSHNGKTQKRFGKFRSFTPLHLAARHGHCDTVRLLLNQPGVDVNVQTEQGTALHEAAMYGHYAVAKILLEFGADTSLSNSYDQIAVDLVNKNSRHCRELKQLLKESSCAMIARALKDYCDITNSSSIAFREGELIKVLEQRHDGWWKGYVINEGIHRTGYFPCSTVSIVDGTGDSRDDDLVEAQHCSYGLDLAFPPPPAFTCALTNLPNDLNTSANEICTNNSYLPCSNRSSATSVDSGRSSANATTIIGYPSVQIVNSCAANAPSNGNHYHPGSLESGICRESLLSTSSSSSLGSLDDYPDDVGYFASSQLGIGNISNNCGIIAAAAVLERQTQGCSDSENLKRWLYDIKFIIYHKALIEAGYDLGVITRMTPEDLNAVGVTNPKHRKKLKAEIGRLAVSDGIPEFAPVSISEWLRCLNLEEYEISLSQQGYTRVEHILDISWEDLEDIGIKKLGHQKKFILAVEKLKRIRRSSNNGSSSTSSTSTTTPDSTLQFAHTQNVQPFVKDCERSFDESESRSLSQAMQILSNRSIPSGSPLLATSPPTTLQRPNGVGTSLLLEQNQQQLKIRPPLTPRSMTKSIIAQNSSRASPNGTLERKISSTSGDMSTNKQPPPPPKRITSIRTHSACSSPSSRRRLPAYENAQQVEAHLRQAAATAAASAGLSGFNPLSKCTEGTYSPLSSLKNGGFQAAKLPAGITMPYSTSTSLPRNAKTPVLSRHTSLTASNTSVDSTTIPFANENIGTIRQRATDRLAKLSISSAPYEASDVIITDSQISLLSKLPPPPPLRLDSDQQDSLKRVTNKDAHNFDDICVMLEGLSAMLDKEISEENS